MDYCLLSPTCQWLRISRLHYTSFRVIPASGRFVMLSSRGLLLRQEQEETPMELDAGHFTLCRPKKMRPILAGKEFEGTSPLSALLFQTSE